jgi:hypothetical protein
MHSLKEIQATIAELHDDLVGSIKSRLSRELLEQHHNYKVVWDRYQEFAIPEIKKILEPKFPDAIFTQTESKSTYPDLQMDFQNFRIAFDIKSHESEKEPWYDIARLDTINESRIKKFNEEYDVVIKYDRKTRKVLDVYFEMLKDTVGIDKRCQGVKFRPYDGKVRPKSWSDFESRKSYWATKEEFEIGIRKSQIYRWKSNIQSTLLPVLTEEEKIVFKKLFE